MDTMIIVEVLEKSGKIHERCKITHFPATIGRAYDCDVILQDDYVSPQHARLTCNESGEILLSDLDSENGTHRLPEMQALSSQPLGAETLVRIGHTLLRFRRTDFAIAPTRIDSLTSQRFARFFNSPLIFAALMLSLLGLLALNSYLNAIQSSKISSLLLEVLEIGIFAPLWAGIWALLSRIFVHHASYVAHGVIASLGVIAFIAANTLVEYYAFLFSAHVSADILFYALAGILASVVLYGHLRFTTLLSARRTAAIAGGIGGVLACLFGLSLYVQSLEFNDALPYPPELKPVPWQVEADKTPEAFVRDAAKLAK